MFPKILNKSKGDQLLAHSWRMKNALKLFSRQAICNKQADCIVGMHVRMGVGSWMDRWMDGCALQSVGVNPLDHMI